MGRLGLARAVVAEMGMARTVISLTPAAADRVRELLASKGEGALGLKLDVKPSGCSGLSYQLDFAREIEPGAEVVDVDGIKVVIEPRAVMYVLGTELDFVADKLGAQFVFRNPNEKARCGCGESFSV
jgi:iron-sulfur cluster assembly protein